MIILLIALLIGVPLIGYGFYNFIKGVYYSIVYGIQKTNETSKKMHKKKLQRKNFEAELNDILFKQDLSSKK